MEREQLIYWRPLDTDPRYEVSNIGLLKRVLPGRGTWVGRITQGAMRADGYLQVFGIGGGFNMMHPERRKLRAASSARNAAKATAAGRASSWEGQRYKRTPALRASLRAKGQAQVQWWVKAGYSNLKAALDARKVGLP